MEKNELRLQAFGRACHIVVENIDGGGKALLSLCQEEMERLEGKFSSYHPDSITSRINQAAGTGAVVSLDAEARSLFAYINALWKESKHIFDPTTRLLQNCYDSSGKLLASPDQLQGMIKLVGWQYLELNEAGAHLSRKGMLVDLNSCIRPYAIDSLRKLLIRNGANHALIEMDQDIATIGKQPDGANWMVGVRFPKGNRIAIARLKLNNKGYAMRGDYEQAALYDGERFGRALSPVDGQPIPGLLCVAVIAENCLTACSAASVARLKTEASGIKWLEKLGMPWMAVDRQLNCHGPLSPANAAG
ncbi:MAG: thiamine biosynthesis lipoprotein [Halioglobus sp.]|jgi:thiamine biosynthesis lipoprotein